MRTRTILAAAVTIAPGTLLGWLAASGRLATAFAQDKLKAESPNHRMQLTGPVWRCCAIQCLQSRPGNRS